MVGIDALAVKPGRRDRGTEQGSDSYGYSKTSRYGMDEEVSFGSGRK